MTSSPFDYLLLTVLDGSGSPISAEYEILDNRYGDGDYAHVYGWWEITLTYNETQERDLAVQIRATTDSSLYSAFFVDDASFVTTCTRYTFGSQGSPSPQPFELEVRPVNGPPIPINEDWVQP